MFDDLYNTDTLDDPANHATIRRLTNEGAHTMNDWPDIEQSGWGSDVADPEVYPEDWAGDDEYERSGYDETSDWGWGF